MNVSFSMLRLISPFIIKRIESKINSFLTMGTRFLPWGKVVRLLP